MLLQVSIFWNLPSKGWNFYRFHQASLNIHRNIWKDDSRKILMNQKVMSVKSFGSKLLGPKTLDHLP